MPRIPDAFVDLFRSRAFAHLATLMPDGSPHLTPVWIDLEEVDGEHLILVNSKRGRVKNRNMHARPQVAVEVQDPDRPYRYVSVRGRVTDRRTAGSGEHIERLAARYLDRSYPWWSDGEVRETYVITPDRVVTADFGGVLDP